MNGQDFIVTLLSKSDVVSEIRRSTERLTKIIPEIRDMIGFDHRHPHHHLDVWEHTLLALSYSENKLKTRLVLLLHDIGKPHSYQFDGEVRHYRGHGEKSAEIAKAVLERLSFDEVFVNSVCTLIKNHDAPLSEEDISRYPDYATELFAVQRCDAMAHNPIYNEKRMAYVEKISKIMTQL